MTATALRVTELDFMSIRDNLKTFLRSQSEFTAYDFEGSGMAILLDLLAFNTHYMAMQLNLVGNEMFLDTAQIRASVLSHAKLTNYVPNTKAAATAIVDILVTPSSGEDNTAAFITLDRYSRFLSEPIDGITYNFITVNANNATLSNGSYLFSNVVIKQGEALTTTYTVAEGQSRFIIDTDSLDASTLRVSVQESEANTYRYTYTKANDITILDGNSAVYFIEENSLKAGNYTLQFGDGVLGKKLANGNIVIADYVVTKGPDANKAGEFTPVNGIAGYQANVIVTTVETAFAGAEKESIENIRYRAPIHYTAQNRSVVTQDYEALLLKDYPNIEAVSVWSGKDNIPPIYGKVFIALKPVNNYVITLAEKERIKDEIIQNRSVMTVFPELVDPEYTYLQIRVKVYYNKSATTLDKDEIKALVRQAILDYRTNELLQFNSSFRKSRLQKYIDDAHPAITSSDVQVYLQKRFEPVLNASQNIDIEFNTSLYKAGSINKLYSYPEIVVLDTDNIERRVFIEEVPDSFTGVDSIVITNTGESYTETPTVTITGDGIGATAKAVIVNKRLSSIDIVNRGSNYSRVIVSITGGGGSGGAATAELQARHGTLRTYYFRSTTGEKVVINSNAGTIDYDEGFITLTSFQPRQIISNTLYDDSTLTINVQPEADTVKTLRSSIIDIDEDDSSSIIIDTVPE